MKKVAVITGANRGLGLATAEALVEKGYRVMALARQAVTSQPLLALQSRVQKQGHEMALLDCDVASDESVTEVARQIAQSCDVVHVLVNNAGVFLDTDLSDAEEAAGLTSLEHTPIKLIRDAFEVNTLGAYRVMSTLAPLLRKSGGANVVNISSGMGQLAEMNGGYPSYRISKTALNAITRILSEELAPFHVNVNSVCPGWVKTDMGGAGAERSLAEGIAGIVWAATLGKSGPTGGFYRDGERLDW